jgi:hypothetical protein
MFVIWFVARAQDGQKATQIHAVKIMKHFSVRNISSLGQFFAYVSALNGNINPDHEKPIDNQGR